MAEAAHSHHTLCLQEIHRACRAWHEAKRICGLHTWQAKLAAELANGQSGWAVADVGTALLPTEALETLICSIGPAPEAGEGCSVHKTLTCPFSDHVS